MSRLRKFRGTGIAAAALLLAVRSASATDFGPQPGDNPVLKWNQALLQGVRESKPGPTVVAREIAVLHTAIFDAWAAYDDFAVPTRPHRSWRRPPAERNDANRAEAISFASYRALVDLFPAQISEFDALITALGYDRGNSSRDLRTPAGIGNSAAGAVLSFRHADGSNQLNGYADTSGYVPVNGPGQVSDPDRWEPLFVSDGKGGFVLQHFTTPHWGGVVPFALPSGDALRPGPPARFPSGEYKAQADELIALSAGLTDFQKLTAEYFADGPSSEFPPGHWCLFAGFVSRRDAHTISEDVKMFFALGNALLDASICAWDAKRIYDSERPGTAIHFLYAFTTILAWAGPYQGTQTIPGTAWRPYQLATVVTPPFPEYFSGHSVFSAAGAEILKSFTGSDAFGASVLIPAGSSRAEPGLVPASDVTFSWPTFSDAANAAGMSRRWGGIHFKQGDLTGRSLGRQVGGLVWQKALSYFDGTAPGQEITALSPPAPVSVSPRH